MKIGLISGSPKHKRSASQALLAGLRCHLPEGSEVVEVNFSAAPPQDKDLLQLCNCQVLVLATPVYVDGLPGHLVACLEGLERTLSIAPAKARLAYAIVNCGFYEPVHCAGALEMAAHWSRRAGLLWGGGLGIGGGGMLWDESSIPLGKGPKAAIGKALKVLAYQLENGRTTENAFVGIGLPRLVYQTTAQRSWRKAVERNGLRPKDLDTRR